MHHWTHGGLSVRTNKQMHVHITGGVDIAYPMGRNRVRPFNRANFGQEKRRHLSGNNVITVVRFLLLSRTSFQRRPVHRDPSRPGSRGPRDARLRRASRNWSAARPGPALICPSPHPRQPLAPAPRPGPAPSPRSVLFTRPLAPAPRPGPSPRPSTRPLAPAPRPGPSPRPFTPAPRPGPSTRPLDPAPRSGHRPAFRSGPRPAPSILSPRSGPQSARRLSPAARPYSAAAPQPEGRRPGHVPPRPSRRRHLRPRRRVCQVFGVTGVFGVTSVRRSGGRRR